MYIVVAALPIIRFFNMRRLCWLSVSWEDMQNSSGEGLRDDASTCGSGGVKLNQAEGMVSALSFRLGERRELEKVTPDEGTSRSGLKVVPSFPVFNPAQAGPP
jgi:hypothetical protein